MPETHTTPGLATPPADGGHLLSVLGDADCRAILGEVGDTPRPAADLARACDLPLSTTYRKLNRLEAAGLLEEHTRLDPDRNHQSEFAAAAVDVSVALDADRGLRVTVCYDDGRDSRSFTLAD